jgi:hypothetical protein
MKHESLVNKVYLCVFLRWKNAWIIFIVFYYSLWCLILQKDQTYLPALVITKQYHFKSNISFPSVDNYVQQIHAPFSVWHSITFSPTRVITRWQQTDDRERNVVWEQPTLNQLLASQQGPQQLQRPLVRVPLRTSDTLVVNRSLGAIRYYATDW